MLKPLFSLVFLSEAEEKKLPENLKFKTALKVSDQWIFISFLKLFECFLYKGLNKDQMMEFLEKEREKENSKLE